MKRFLLIAFLLLAVFLFAGGLFLKRGVHVESFSAGPATLQNVSLVWKSKLELQIGSLTVDLSREDTEEQPLDLSVVEKVIPLVQWIDRFFSRISVQEIKVGEIRGTLLYAASQGHITLDSALLDLEAAIRLADGFLLADIQSLNSEQFHSRASGALSFDIHKQTGSGKLTANLADSLPVTLEFNADSKQLSFQGTENGVITTITPFVDLFGLSQNIQRWITKYLTGDRYTLNTFSGDFPWNNPLHLLESFYAEVRVEDCQYTFAPGLEPIKTDYTDVTFKKGVLGIAPHDSTFYGQDGEDSWLDINFNDFDNILLTAYIISHAVGNADIVNLLKYYDIPLPFVQTEGKTEVDLSLAINLNRTEINTKGRFQIDAGVLEFQNTPFRVKDAEVTLLDSSISIEKLQLSFEELFKVGINGGFDARTKMGDIDIVLQDVNLAVGESALKLDTSKSEPTLQYQIRPDGPRVDVGASSWILDTLTVHLGSFNTAFSFEDLSGELPPTLFSVANTFEAEISGPFSLKGKKIDLQGSVQKLHVRDLLLKDSNTPIRVRYEDGWTVYNLEKSHWNLGAMPLTLYPAKFSYNASIFTFDSDKIVYDDLFDAGISGFYDQSLLKGELIIKEPHFRTEELVRFLDGGAALTVQLDATKEPLQMAIPELDLAISIGNNKQWSAQIKDLQSIHGRSELLQQFKLDSGQLAASSAGGGEPIKFSADIPYQYPVLVFEDQPIEQYHITGTVSDGNVQAEVNEKVTLHYDDALVIHSEDVSYNIPVLFEFIKECLPPEDDVEADDSKPISATLTANNSGLYFSNESYAMADSIILSSINKKIDMELNSGEGRITLDMKGGVFSLQGENLNDTFMNGLSPDAHVRKGLMALAVQGTAEEFSALIKVTDTVLEDLKSLNNVLALVNTIPALITFSLPTYSSSGLPVTSFVTGMKVKDGLATFESMNLDSPEMSMAGSGWINFPEKTIEMDLNLITQSKKNINKIPLVGYILAGKEKHPSITMKVFGDLMDPEVEHKVFRDVATLPFGILFRTLALPVHLASPLFDSGETEEIEKSEVKSAKETSKEVQKIKKAELPEEDLP